jgi:hypothetical protein
MKVVEIHDREGLDRLRLPWNELLVKSRSASIFLTWEWVTAWWEAYGRPGELNILALYDDDGELCGVAPLRRRTVSRYGQRRSTLSFVGDGSNDSEYLDFIFADGYERAALDRLRPYFHQELQNGTVLRNTKHVAKS